MSKKKSTQKQTFLSPENYIRQKSRNLPICKCTINSDWEKAGLASVLIARQHSNGNITFCFYLVDLKCLGIKETAYRFNQSLSTLDEEERHMEFDTEEISYELAHNIIYAAIEFAEEYGFAPHKDFTSVTQYFLEEDTDDIPLIEIHCGGEDGKPLYFNVGNESPARQNQILKQLSKTAGEGNYHYFLPAESLTNSPEDEVEDDEYDEKDEDYEYHKLYSEMKKMEDDEYEKAIVTTIREYLDRKEDIDHKIFSRVRAVIDILLDNGSMQDVKKYEKYLKMLKKDLGSIPIEVSEKTPNSLFPDISPADGESIADDFYDFYVYILSNKKERSDDAQVEKELQKFSEKYGKCPAGLYLNLTFCENTEREKEFLEEIENYPDYFLFSLHKIKPACRKLPFKKAQSLLVELVKEKTLTCFEASQFILFYTSLMLDLMNPEHGSDLLEKLDALDMFIDEELCYYDFVSKTHLYTIRMLKVEVALLRMMEVGKERLQKD